MATGTFTYNALRPKTLKERIKTKNNCKSFKVDKSNAVSVGATAIKPDLSICSVGLVWSHGIVVKCTAVTFFLMVDY